MSTYDGISRAMGALLLASALVLVGGCDDPSAAGQSVDDVRGRLDEAEKHLAESGEALAGADAKLGALEESLEALEARCAPLGEPITVGLAPANGEPVRCLSAQGAVVPCERAASWIVTKGQRPPAETADTQAKQAGDEGESAGESG